MQRAFVLLTFALSLATTRTQAQNVPPSQPPKIPLSLNGANMNDALVELGRAANLNFMADATHFAPDASPLSIDSTLTLPQHLAELNASQKLTWLPSKRALLLWSAPDLRQLAQYAVDGQGIKLVEPEQVADSAATSPQNKAPRTTLDKAAPKPTQQELLFEDLTSYFQDKQNWDGKTPGAISEVRISDLPPALHDRVVAAVQSAVLRPESQIIWKGWFSDDFWNNAELKIMEEDNGNPNGPKIPVLTVGATMRLPNGTGGSMMSLGALKGKTGN